MWVQYFVFKTAMYYGILIAENNEKKEPQHFCSLPELVVQDTVHIYHIAKFQTQIEITARETQIRNSFVIMSTCRICSPN
jgi:ABC-type iron transport system FetAB permease component